MIYLTFNNWELCAYRAEPPAYQFDDGTVAVVVDGDIPSGWAWELLIAYGDNLDIAAMERSDNGLVVALSAQQLAFSGYYTMQLRASQNALVKHSAPVMVYIGESISGDAHWPEIPTAFTQALERAEEALTAAQEVQESVSASEAAAAQSAGDAAGSASAAAESYAAAADAVSKYPRITTDTGNWAVWDADGSEWVDTGVHAQGQQGDPGAVQDVMVDGQSVLVGGVAGISSGAVTKSGMTGASPAWSQAEQLAARQRLGMDKEWTLVGTIAGDENDRGNIDTGVDVDLSGYTELYFIGRAITTVETEFSSNKQRMIYGCFSSSRKFTVARFVETQFGFDCPFVKYSTIYDNMGPNNNGNGYCNYSGIKFTEINKFYLNTTSGVTKCDIKIYAR